MIKEEELQTEVIRIIDLAEAFYSGEKYEPGDAIPHHNFKLQLVQAIDQLGPVGLLSLADILSQSRA